MTAGSGIGTVQRCGQFGVLIWSTEGSANCTKFLAQLTRRTLKCDTFLPPSQTRPDIPPQITLSHNRNERKCRGWVRTARCLHLHTQGRLSDAVADAPNPRGQCRSWVEPCRSISVP